MGSWNLGSIIFLDVIGALIAVFMLVISAISELDHNEKIGKIHILKEACEKAYK